MEQHKPLLSICIPTYNRSAYLEICLQNFCEQLKQYSKEIELIVSDNCSIDNTDEIVERFIKGGNKITYLRNETNIGPDANIVECVKKCNGDFFWVFGDDDHLLENKLQPIIANLRTNEYSMIYLENYWFDKDPEKERPQHESNEQVTEYSDKKKFLEKVNIWTTFLSAGIFSRQILSAIDPTAFIGSHMNHLQWVLSSIFSKGKCLYMHSYYIACKTNNTGGYGLFTTFGPNLNEIMESLISRKLIPDYTKHLLNYYFIKDFMPVYCLRYKQNKLAAFDKETSPFVLLKPLYKKYLIYWFILFPIDILPYYLSKKYYFGLKKLKLI